MGKPVPTISLHREKAEAILQGNPPTRILKGPKTVAFYQCIAKPEEDGPVCVDVHAFSAWIGRAQHGFRLTEDLYETVADAYRSVAATVGVPACSLQAVVWCQWRSLRWQKSLY